MRYLTKSELNRCLKSMAVLDIILLPEEDAWLRLVDAYALEKGYAYVIDNGSGDRLMVFITPDGAYMKGFDHENKFNQFAAEEWDDRFFEELYQNAPSEFLKLLTDDEEQEEATFCMWCIDDTDEWQQNENPKNDGGREYLLGYIAKNAEEWCKWAREYYERDIDFDIVNKIYQGEVIDSSHVMGLNPNRNAKEAMQEINEIK